MSTRRHRTSRPSPRRVARAAAAPCGLELLERRTLMCALPHRHDNPVELRPDLVGVTLKRDGGGDAPDGAAAPT